MQYLDFFKLKGKYRFREKIEYLKKFRKYRYDAAYILGAKFRFALFGYLIEAKEKIGYTVHHGFRNRRRAFFLTRTGKFLDLLAMDGMRIADPFIDLF